MPTAGAFFVLTSNCFMDDLGEVFQAENIPGRPPSEVYEATRAEMERRIFDEHIACSNSDGRASPFAAGKMRDRMRGNVWPFLPLSENQLIATFELELEERAAMYEATNGVSLYWTREFARLAVMPPTSPSAQSHARLQTGTLASMQPDISVRKRIDILMRLDSLSVERIYAAGVARCRPRRMSTLILHMRGGKPAGESVCDDSKNITYAQGPLDADTFPNHSDVTADSSARTSSRQRQATHLTHSSSRASTSSLARAVAIDANTNRAFDTHAVSSHSDVEENLRIQLESVMQLANEQASEVERLRDEVHELQQSLFYWKLAFAALVLVNAVATLVTLLWASHVFGIYMATMIKLAMWSTAAVLVVTLAFSAAALVLCHTGTSWACVLVRILQNSIYSAWWFLRFLMGAHGALLFLACLACVVALIVMCAGRCLRWQVKRDRQELEELQNHLKVERQVMKAEIRSLEEPRIPASCARRCARDERSRVGEGSSERIAFDLESKILNLEDE